MLNFIFVVEGKTQAQVIAQTLAAGKLDAGLEAYLMDGVLTIRAPPKAHPIKIVAVNGHFPAAAPDDTKRHEERDDGLTAEEKADKVGPKGQ